MRSQRGRIGSIGMMVLGLGWIVVFGQCSSSSEKSCATGSEGCKCTQGGACDPGLACYSNLCVQPTPSTKLDAASSADTPLSSTDGGNGGSIVDALVASGSGEVNADAPATGGAGGAAMDAASVGGASAGGASGSGGSALDGTISAGGTTGIGGSAGSTGSGGASSQGGSTSTEGTGPLGGTTSVGGASPTGGGSGNQIGPASYCALISEKWPSPAITTPDPQHWPRECLAEELPLVSHAVPTTTSMPTVDVVVKGGVLFSVAGRECVFCALHQPTFTSDTLYTCSTEYACGSGPDAGLFDLKVVKFLKEAPYWEIVSSMGGGDLANSAWTLGPANTQYPECKPKCAGQCGPDGCGNVCGTCAAGEICQGDQCQKILVGGSSGGSSGGVDVCSACISSCSGLPSCCTGAGCMCMDACAPTGCLSGAALCCGYDGFCFCDPNCPY